MKLVVEDDKDTSCNGNGILDDQIKKMISSVPPKVSSNGDVHTDDSRSNSDSLNGSGDLLIEDPNIVRNGSDDIPFQNGSKPDDTRSWSSNSSNFPPPDIDEDLSDEMTLRLTDEEEECENTPESTENKKDSVLQHTSSPLLMADQNTLSDKNQITKLLEDDTQSNIKQKPSDNISDKTDETNKSPELESLISEIMPDTSSVIDNDKDKSVTELREEMEELLNDDDFKDKAQIVQTNNFNDKNILSDIELNSSTSTVNNLTNEESSSNLNKENEVDSTTLIKEKKSEEETTYNHSEKNEDIKDIVTKTNENEEMKEMIGDKNEVNQEQNKDVNSFEIKEQEKDNDSLENKEEAKNDNLIDRMETEQICEDISKLGNNINESSIISNEKDDETNKDEDVLSKHSEEINAVGKSVSVEAESNSVSDNISEETKSEEAQINSEAIVDDESQINTEASVNDESQINTEATVNDESQINTEASVNDESQINTETTINNKSQINTEPSVNDEPQINTETTINDDVNIKVSDEVSNENLKKSNDEVTNENLKKSNDEVNNENLKKSNDEINAIPEPMETESNSDKIIDQLESTNSTNAKPTDSEPMEIDSNDDIEKIIETTNNTNVEEISDNKKNDSLVDNKDNLLETKELEEIKSESVGKVEIVDENIKGTKDEESTKSLKRSLETEVNEVDAKKAKIIIKPKQKREYVPMNYFREFLSKKEVKSLSREELEEFCLQKMCEAINQTSKVGDLNRLVKQQEQVIESLRTKYNGLKKQIGDISIVQNKMLQEVRAAKGKDGGSANVMPVKITRSVGLQVSLQPSNRARPIIPTSPEQLVAAPQQKRKVQRISLPNKLPSAQTPVTPITPAKPVSATIPKSPNVITTPATTPSPMPTSAANKIVKTILPRTYSGPEPNKDVSSSTNSLLGNYLTNPSPKPSTPNVARKTMTPTNAVSSTATTTTATSTKVIDLTDEDDIAKTASTIPATPAGIRVVAPHQINNTSTAVTSQMQRLTYLVSPGQQGQVLLATTSAPTRPGGPRSTIMFKPVQQGQVPNGQRLNLIRPHTSGGTVTVLPATSTASIRAGQQIRFQTSGTTVNSVRPQMISSTRITPTQRHPAPLPGPPAVQPSQPTWKAMPPKPSLKISKVGDGIVLSWKMLNKDMSLYEDIASYQLYAYQETNALPSTDMWRKVGDVKALALPMACTLTQFTDGNKYHFAVRAVDVKSRVGPFSQPEQIALP